ncbi:DUF6344 domain-containing protein [Streptomyces virginiae]|uniref:DUF6344 domain-containing protein n=1 Tax=Streptomyces virginiae TaxID=1961 RepID=UPI002253E3A2|nr:DUF6344 domain-containing protein [Streptomyces virginiae]MCX4959524.1 DUF6344 domain-containing protein [Streptomyces virginiae]
MTHRSILTSIWTSVLAALMAVLSGFGLAAKSAPAAASAPAAEGTEGAEATAVRRPAVAARRSWRAMMRGGSLPPTIKQRIRAEAHGKTPSVRRSTTAAAMGAGTGSGTGTGTGTGTASRTLTSAAVPAATQTAVPAPAAAVPAAATGAARDALALAA